MQRRSFLILAALAVLFAFGLREWFVLTMTVPEPNQGDVGAYLRYAMHMAWDHSFSMGEEAATPDAFRSPGYPMLLYLLFPGDWTDGRWFARIYQAQAVLGALTVAGVIALARQWLSRGWALLAGVLIAVQAHHVVATGAILLEVLFGALLVAALLALSVAVTRRSWRWGAAAGLLMGLGALTNPVLSLLPFLLLPLLWRDARRPALAMVAVALLAMGSWSLRNVLVGADAGARAAINFVQGSWPECHDAIRAPSRYPAAWREMNEEIALVTTAPAQGVRRVLARMAQQPGRYVGWYLYKPWLLFDWEVRVGQGGVYVVDMRDTIFDRGAGKVLAEAQRTLNPLLFALALLGLLPALARGGSARLVAVALVYLSLVHVALQAEPRYAIPYRSLEILLAVGCLAWLRLAGARWKGSVGQPWRQRLRGLVGDTGFEPVTPTMSR